jgi:hypothetical protein
VGGLGGSAPQHGTADPARLPKATEQGRPEVVEVPGIEPGSSVAFPGLLRAQFTVPLLGPTGHVNKPM